MLLCTKGLDDGEDISPAYKVQEIDDEDGKKTIFSLNISGTPADEVNLYNSILRFYFWNPRF
jgi:hypothetical protein